MPCYRRPMLSLLHAQYSQYIFEKICDIQIKKEPHAQSPRVTISRFRPYPVSSEIIYFGPTTIPFGSAFGSKLQDACARRSASVAPPIAKGAIDSPTPSKPLTPLSHF